MSKRRREPDWHVLDFFCDDASSCALTVYLFNSRVHVIADASKLHSKSAVGAEYWDLVQRLQQEDDEYLVEERKSDGSGDQDSGVDVSHDRTRTSTTQETYQHVDVEAALQSWMLAPLLRDSGLLESTKAVSKHRTLQQWYHCSTQFFELAVSDSGDRLEAIELEAIPELKKEIENIQPSARLPKYILNSIEVPLLRASDLQVLE